MKKILTLFPERVEFALMWKAIKEDIEAHNEGYEVLTHSGLVGESSDLGDRISVIIENSDLIICDVSMASRHVLYILGYVYALKKPVIMVRKVNDEDILPIELSNIMYLSYDPKNLIAFMGKLYSEIDIAIRNPKGYIAPARVDNKVFVSYSHTDLEFLERLLIHLKPLEKQGLIDLWVDTKIQVGDLWKPQIETALSHAKVAVLLITADFLASDFIVENELPPLLSQAETNGTRIIPVILKPCRFTRDQNLSRFQAVNNPEKPVITLSIGEQELVYDRIAQIIEGAK
jgi:TIR domain